MGSAFQTQQELKMGTVTPPSFLCQDLIPWLTAEGYDFCADTATSSAGTCGTCGIATSDAGVDTRPTAHMVCEFCVPLESGASSPANSITALLRRWGSAVRIGRLRRGRQAPVAHTSDDDVYIPVRVDRHGSHVGNPFCSAPTAQLCRAYNELLLTLLMVPINFEESLLDYEGLMQDPPPTAALLSPFEEDLLFRISEKYNVRVHRIRVRPLDVRAWLVHHALLLLRGRCLLLKCWCTCGLLCDLDLWVCHAQLLAGALLWLALTSGEELLAARPLPQLTSLPEQVHQPPAHVCTPTYLRWRCRAYSLASPLGTSRGGNGCTLPLRRCLLPLTLLEQVASQRQTSCPLLEMAVEPSTRLPEVRRWRAPSHCTFLTVCSTEVAMGLTVAVSRELHQAVHSPLELVKVGVLPEPCHERRVWAA